MSNPRNTRAVAWLMLSILLVLLSYSLSFGPACWLADRGVVPIDAVFKAYAPIISAMREVEPFRRVFLWYAEVGSPDGSFIALVLLISATVEPSTGDLIEADPIDNPDDAGLPAADENVILDEAPCLTNPPSEKSLQGVPPDG